MANPETSPATPPATPKRYTVHELSNLLHLDRETIRRYIREGRIHGTMSNGRSGGYTISASEVSRFLENREPLVWHKNQQLSALYGLLTSLPGAWQADISRLADLQANIKAGEIALEAIVHKARAELGDAVLDTLIEDADKLHYTSNNPLLFLVQQTAKRLVELREELRTGMLQLLAQPESLLVKDELKRYHTTFQSDGK